MKQKIQIKKIFSYLLIAVILNPLYASAFVVPETVKPRPSIPGVTTGNTTILVPESKPTYEPGVGTDNTLGNSTSNQPNNSSTEVIGGTITNCAAQIGARAAISAIIASLGIKEAFTNVPVGQTSGNISDAYQTGSKFGDDIKNLCLDPAARAIYKKMLLQTEQSVFNWANNGFKGGPTDGNTFINDISSYLGSVKDAATETWISDQDKNNIFYDDIMKATYRNARNTNNGYTSDLAESIVTAECQTYQGKERSARSKNITDSSSGINGLLNNALNFFGGNQLPTNNPGFQNGGFGTPRSGAPLEGGTFYYNILKVKTAYALDGASALEASANDTSPTLDINQDLNNRPCYRKASTAAEKQAVIDAYNAGQISVSPQFKWSLIGKSIQPNNRKNSAVQAALNSKSNYEGRAQSSEQIQLSNNSGNTGARQCVSYIRFGDATDAKTCRSDGWRTVTPGSILVGSIIGSTNVPLENLNKLTSTGTFSDIAQAVLNGLMGGLTNQLINNTNGLLSFNGKAANSSQGEFTRGIATLNNTKAPVADVRTSINRIAQYTKTLEKNVEALSTIVNETESARDLCSKILPLWQSKNSPRELSGDQATKNHRCNIDSLTLDYRNDPTAGIKLSQNPIYKEVSILDGTRGERDQGRISLQNTQSTLASLKRTESKYTSGTDSNRESTFSSEIAALVISIPGEDSIAFANSQTSSLSDREGVIKKVVAELEAELADLKI